MEYSRALREGRSGIRYFDSLKELKFGCQVGGKPADEGRIKDYVTPEKLPMVNEAISYGIMAAVDAFRDADLMIPGRKDSHVYKDTGAIIGTGIGAADTLGEKIFPNIKAGKVRRLGSSVVEMTMVSAVAAKIGEILALGNQVTTNSSACSTGNEAIIMGFERIQAGHADRMVVGGVEGSDPHIWGPFDAMRVLCRKFNDQPERASRPMSESAAGFVPGSGCGILIIEELETARKRGAPIYAEILAGNINSGGMRNGGTMTAPGADGARECIRNTIRKAGIEPTDIDYINGHLTGTMADPLEIENWSAALGLGPDKFPMINATKSMIGHGLGASGALETVATVLQMHEGFVHPSLNCEDMHPLIKPFHDSIVQETRESAIKTAVKASFGFGDVNSCIILKHWETSS